MADDSLAPTRKIPRGVSRYTDRHGHVRWRFRRAGLPAVPLPSPFGTPEFWAAYDAASRGEGRSAATRRAAPGSVAAAIESLKRSTRWAELDASTQAVRARIYDALARTPGPQGRTLGDMPLRAVSRKFIAASLDALADRPHAANNRLKAWRALMQHALAHEMIDADPTLGVAWVRAPRGGHRTWTAAEIAQYLAHHGAGTKARLALLLTLTTGARRSDVVRLGRQHREGAWLRVDVAKGAKRRGQVLRLPVVPALDDELARVQGQLTYLQTEYGQPFSVKGFGAWFRRQVQAAGLPAGLSAHGLRKATATVLAHHGATTHAIRAQGGWASLRDVETYTAAVEQQRLAGANAGTLQAFVAALDQAAKGTKK